MDDTNLLFCLSLLLSLFNMADGRPLSGCDQVGYYCYWMSNSSALSNYDAQFVQQIKAVCPSFQPQPTTTALSHTKVKHITIFRAISGTSVWLGYWNYNSHSASAPGSWSDKNGTGLSGFYTNWNAGEPNDASPGEKCVNLNGNMNDLSCTYPQQFVCQSSLPLNCNYCQVSGSVCFFYGPGANNMEAQSLCNSNGATLPTFNNAADLTNLNTWTGSSRIWVGYWNYAAHSASAPGVWQTQNGVGAAGAYLPWASGEPNDWGTGEKCAETPGSLALNDVPCNYVEYTTVCQCLIPTLPTTTLSCANCDRTAANCYLTINAAATNANAKTICSNAGGVLATFKNLTELNNFRTYMWPRRTEPSGVWVGYWNFAAHSASSPGVWTDQNGNPTSYAGWNSGEPNDGNGIEKCAAMFAYGTGPNDIPCNYLLTPTICDCFEYTSTTSTSTTSSTTSSSTTSPTTTSTSTTSSTTPTTTSTSTTSTTTPTTTSTSTTSTTTPTTTSTSNTSTTTPTTTSTSTTSTTTPTTTSTSTTSTTTPTTTSTSTTSTTTPTTTSTSTTSTTTPNTTFTSTTSTTTPTTTSTSNTSTATPTTTSTTTPTTTSTSTTSTATPTTSTTSSPNTSTSTTSTSHQSTSSTIQTSVTPMTSSTPVQTVSSPAARMMSSTGITGTTVAEASTKPVSTVKAIASSANPGWIFYLLFGVVSLITLLFVLTCCWIICGDKRHKKNFKGQTEPQAKH